MKRIANECFFAWVESEIKSGRSVKFRVKRQFHDAFTEKWEG